MSKEVIEIAGKHLGQTVSKYSDSYDPSLLVKVPRNLNRKDYNIKSNKLPFIGVDVWNAYEVSALTQNGRPVTGVLKIAYSAASQFHVESKSIKLYLNSFNMTKYGNTKEECIDKIENVTIDKSSDEYEKYLNT